MKRIHKSLIFFSPKNKISQHILKNIDLQDCFCSVLAESNYHSLPFRITMTPEGTMYEQTNSNNDVLLYHSCH